jgi:hypothetical protein
MISMWLAPPVFVLLQGSLSGKWVVWDLEMGSVLKHLKMMLDVEHATPGMVKLRMWLLISSGMVIFGSKNMVGDTCHETVHRLGCLHW